MTLRVLTLDDRFWSKVNKTDECWLWTGSVDGYGYGMFRVGQGRVRRAHRVSYEIEHGPVPDGTVFLHACDNPPCVNPSHLRPGSRAENNADRDRKGRHSPLAGEAHPAAVLTAKDVEAIRSAPRQAGAAKEMSARYGVSIGTIYGLRSKGSQTWRGVG